MADTTTSTSTEPLTINMLERCKKIIKEAEEEEIKSWKKIFAEHERDFDKDMLILNENKLPKVKVPENVKYSPYLPENIGGMFFKKVCFEDLPEFKRLRPEAKGGSP